MKLNNARSMQILALVSSVVVIYWLAKGKAPARGPVAPSGDGNGKWQVLGSMACGFTRKQLDYMKSKKIPFEYTECQGGKCPGVEAFPTLMSPNGQKIVGYTEM
jgi:hypothetical protein